ncbi:MAG: cell wall-active antibiotics response protein [Caldilineaceae bacterium]|nr:cell wall-active antibiotics response protein [Caldilineaceae bacterium]
MKIVLILAALQVALVWWLRSLRKRYLAETVSEDEVNAVAVTDGVEKTNSSQDFKGGFVRAVMGGIELDLTETAVKKPPAVLHATIVMGGVDIKVPKEWKVRGDVGAIMGGVDGAPGRRPSDDERAPDLFITGKVIMGGLAVHN